MTASAPVIRAQVERGNAALIGFLPLGFPSVAQSVEAAQVLLANGVDVIELGFPYSDPAMDGPVIQEATRVALERGVHLEDLLEAVETLSETGAPILSMTYWNPIHWYGIDRFAHDFAAAGGAGLITPDLPPDDAHQWIDSSNRLGLERVFLAAPSSTPQRLRTIANASNGWVYAASTMGVTGQRREVDSHTQQLVADCRHAGAETVCVGLGVSDGAQARQIGRYADGVIVGSAYVRPLLDQDFDTALQSLALLAQEMRLGVDGAREGSR